jgi:ankyrin repeat protein
MDIAKQIPELIQAIESRELTRIKELLELGVDPNIEFEGIVPLQRTVLQVPNNKEMTSLLLEYGANVQVEDEQGYPIFHNAFIVPRCRPRRTRGVSSTFELVTLLLRHAVNVNRIPYNSHTALECAVSYTCIKDKKITLALLNAGASCSVYCKTHLFVEAAGNFDIQVIKKMLANNGNEGISQDILDAALIRAVGSGRLNTVRFLLKKGADVHAKTNEQNTALHRAVYKGNNTIMKLLLQAGADCNIQNIYGDTPLMDLLDNTDLSQDICKAGSKLLISYGADYKQLRNNKHQTAADIARLRGIDLDKLT